MTMLKVLLEPFAQVYPAAGASRMPGPKSVAVKLVGVTELLFCVDSDVAIALLDHLYSAVDSPLQPSAAEGCGSARRHSAAARRSGTHGGRHRRRCRGCRMPSCLPAGLSVLRSGVQHTLACLSRLPLLCCMAPRSQATCLWRTQLALLAWTDDDMTPRPAEPCTTPKAASQLRAPRLHPPKKPPYQPMPRL